MATLKNGTVSACSADTSVSPPVYGVTISFPAIVGPPPQAATEKIWAPIGSDHYLNCLKALGSTLKVDADYSTDAQGNDSVTKTTAHT